MDGREVEMARPTIGDVGRGLVEKLARRRIGVVIPELAGEFLEVSVDAARRYLLRGVREGWLRRSGETRRRDHVFGASSAGRPAIVFRAPRQSGAFWRRERVAERPGTSPDALRRWYRRRRSGR